jgi:flagellar basal-body rod modification protein FlgD
MTTTGAILPTGNGATAANPPPANLSAPLTQTDFLNLLMTQLKYQNPLEPMTNADFSAQLAQFSTLDGIQQLNSTFSNTALLQSVAQGASLIGKTVSFGSGSKGKVDSVQISNGQPVLMVGGNPVPFAQVQQVSA